MFPVVRAATAAAEPLRLSKRRATTESDTDQAETSTMFGTSLRNGRRARRIALQAGR